MAQLSDDSFAFGGKLMPVDDATAILSSRVRLVEHVEIVDLGHADGRILAADICAPLPLPPSRIPPLMAMPSAVETFREIPRESSLSSAGLRQGPLQSRP